MKLILSEQSSKIQFFNSESLTTGTCLVIFETNANSYGAYMPDLPGCVAIGETMEEVRGLIAEAILNHTYRKKPFEIKMKRKHKKKPKLLRNLALKRIEGLFSLAHENKMFNSNRLIFIARKIATRYKVKLTKQQKMLFCKFCGNHFSKPGNFRVRLHKKRIIRQCLVCKNYKRVPYSKTTKKT